MVRLYCLFRAQTDSYYYDREALAGAATRAAKLYDALETGEFGSGELAPRIKSLFQKQEDLMRALAEAEEALERPLFR